MTEGTWDPHWHTGIKATRHRLLLALIAMLALVTIGSTEHAGAVLVQYNDAPEVQNHFEVSCCFADLAGGQTQLASSVWTAEIYSRYSSGANYASSSSVGTVSMVHAKPSGGAVLKSWCRWTYPSAISGSLRTQCWQRV